MPKILSPKDGARRSCTVIPAQGRERPNRKERTMSNKNHRVLGRIGAHELTPEQVEQVAGSIGTPFTKIITGALPPHDLLNDV
jgi:hypothetical protein